jgi:hypothetical protein
LPRYFISLLDQGEGLLNQGQLADLRGTVYSIVYCTTVVFCTVPLDLFQGSRIYLSRTQAWFFSELSSSTTTTGPASIVTLPAMIARYDEAELIRELGRQKYERVCPKALLPNLVTGLSTYLGRFALFEFDFQGWFEATGAGRAQAPQARRRTSHSRSQQYGV